MNNKMSQTRKPINYEKKYKVQIESNGVRCLECDKFVKLWGYAVGNKTAEGECQHCGKYIKIPLEKYLELTKQ